MSRFRINSPKVIHQIFETEVVVVHLETGSYYSVEGPGIDIWRMLEQRRDADDIVESFTRGANGCADGNAQAVRAFLQNAADEALIVPDEAAATNGFAPQNGHHLATLDLAATPPRIQKFTDMRDLLLLDPIHELDETGWPLGNQRPVGT